MSAPCALVIEDDLAMLEVVSASLEKRGYEVRQAQTFEDGLAALEDDFFSFVVADIFLPGMGGIDGIQQLKKRFEHIPVIAMSGGWSDMSGEEAIEAAQMIGADAGVAKPIDVAAFEAVLSKIGRGNPSDL